MKFYFFEIYSILITSPIITNLMISQTKSVNYLEMSWSATEWRRFSVEPQIYALLHQQPIDTNPSSIFGWSFESTIIMEVKLIQQ